MSSLGTLKSMSFCVICGGSVTLAPSFNSDVSTSHCPRILNFAAQAHTTGPSTFAFSFCPTSSVTWLPLSLVVVVSVNVDPLSPPPQVGGSDVRLH
jgi:hypothetical protein